MSKHFAKMGLVLINHPRAHRAGEAMALYCWGLAYARLLETDGVIERDALRGAWSTYKQALAHAKKLVEVGLWSEVDGGFRVERYDEWNDTADDIESRRASDRARKSRASRPHLTNISTTSHQHLSNISATSDHNRADISESVTNDVADFGDNSARNPALEKRREEKRREDPEGDARAREPVETIDLKPTPSRPPPLDATLTPDVAQAFVAGVQTATGRPFARPTAGECRALLEAVTAHSRGSKGHELILWTQGAAERFARVSPASISVWRFRDWLNAGQPATANPSRRRVDIGHAHQPTREAFDMSKWERALARKGTA